MSTNTNYPSDQEVVDDLVEMGVVPAPVAYTGVRLVDFFLNHHMTPLFTMFLATAVLRYLYSTGRIFPLAEEQRLPTAEQADTAMGEKGAAARPMKESDPDAASAKTGKNESDSVFRLGYVTHSKRDSAQSTADQTLRAAALLDAAEHIKNVELVDCRKLHSDIPAIAARCDAVYVGLSIAGGREDVVRALLAAGKSVLVEHPAAPSATGVVALQRLANKTGVSLVEAVPPRFAMSWERVIGTLHAEVGDVNRVEVEFVTGFVRRAVLRIWSCLCLCGCCRCLTGRSGTPNRRRHNADPSIDDATLLSLSLVAEILEAAGSAHRRTDGRGGGGGQDGSGAGSPGFFRWKSSVGSRGSTHARGKGAYVYQLQEGGGGDAGGSTGVGTNGVGTRQGGNGASVPVVINCEVGSHVPWFPRARLKVVGSEATVVYDAFDSPQGEQVVRVQSKHGFSHTDRVASVFDTYTLAIVSFVRECKFGVDNGAVSGGQVWATAKALAAARKLGLR